MHYVKMALYRINNLILGDNYDMDMVCCSRYS